MTDFNSFYVETLGCPKNEVDTRVIYKALIDKGLRPSPSKQAEIIIINSCGFLQEALKELEERIAFWQRRKKEILVTGCAVERLGKNSFKNRNLRAAYIDELTGIQKTKHAKQLTLPTKDNQCFCGQSLFHYVKIQEGCSRRCSYCVISKIRGPLRSRPPVDILDEIKMRYDAGAKEFILIAEDLTLYGIDIGETLEKLLLKLPEGPWYRLMYLHPHGLNEKVICTIRDTNGILPYLHVPVQHVSERVLKSMKRAGGRKAVLRSIELIRKYLKGFFVRVDIMVGFPEESDNDFKLLLDFVEKEQPERISVFKYSHEPGTSSFEFEDLDPELKEDRFQMAFEVAREVMYRVQKRLIGEDILVFKNGNETWSQFDAPFVDFRVLLPRSTGKNFVGKVRITDVREDLDVVGMLLKP